jgi:predicted nucleotidyltransferase
MLAVKHIKKAKAVAKFLSWFPYIRGIAISGSLSKNFADENSDLDFFIITAANRFVDSTHIIFFSF